MPEIFLGDFGYSGSPYWYANIRDDGYKIYTKPDTGDLTMIERYDVIDVYEDKTTVLIVDMIYIDEKYSSRKIKSDPYIAIVKPHISEFSEEGETFQKYFSCFEDVTWHDFYYRKNDLKKLVKNNQEKCTKRNRVPFNRLTENTS
ncbi:MAG: hypothetical protein AAF549_06980 [Pseudomonadota bacterium]